MRRLLSGVLALAAPVCAQPQPTLPPWLLAYPGAHVVRSNLSAMSAASFTTADAPETVVDYYRQALASQGLMFAPKSNRFTTTIRTDADCGELSISIMKRDDGASVQLNCRVKFQPQVPKSTGSHDQNRSNGRHG
jgi:hypothetical protein